MRAVLAREPAPVPQRGWSVRDLVGTGSSPEMRDGQPVIVAARWVLILAGLVLILWNPGTLSQLRVQIMVVLGLAVTNFFLHAQLLVRRPMLDTVVYLTSAADIAVITLLVLTQGGFSSNLYIFYFPAILAISVAFSPSLTAIFAGGAIGLYDLIALAGAQTDADLQQVMVRTIMLAAVVVCGSIYWHLERTRMAALPDMPERESLSEQPV